MTATTNHEAQPRRRACPTFIAEECRSSAVRRGPPFPALVNTQPTWRGLWLVEARVRSGLSIPAVAARAGISPDDVRAAEHADSPENPRVRALLAAYGATLQGLRDEYGSSADFAEAERRREWMAARLRVLRRACGIGVYDLARRMGTCWRSIVEAERGGPEITATALAMLGPALGVDRGAVVRYICGFARDGLHAWVPLRAVLATRSADVA